jgi:hypothetical protein
MAAQSPAPSSVTTTAASGAPAAAPARARRHFGALFQAILVVWMLASMALIGQQWNFTLYKVGMISLIISALSQIAVGNIPITATASRSLRMYLTFMAIVVVVFAVSILIAPTLVALGR